MIFSYLFSSVLLISLNFPFISVIFFFLSFRSTFCFTNPDYRLIRRLFHQLLRISEGLLYYIFKYYVECVYLNEHRHVASRLILN
jgi:hypothetical protein